MNREDFLAQTAYILADNPPVDITSLSDTDALVALENYESVKGRLISPDMMLAFLTGFDLIDILDTPAENPSTPMTKEAKGLRKAFSFGSEFNLIVGHPSSQLSLLTQMSTDSIVSTTFVDYCVNHANPTYKPFLGTTLEQLKQIRYPAVWSPCNHGADSYTLSKSNFDVIVMSVLLSENVSTVSIRCYWSTSVGTQEVLATSALTIRGTDSLSLSRGFTRAELGVPTTAKVLRFEYTSVYDGVVTSVSVSK
jgi:hypothetical protein